MDFIRRKPIATYLIVMYGLAALIYAPPLLGTAGLGLVAIEIPVTLFLLISTITLAVVAFAVTAGADGRAGVRDLRGRAFRFRTSIVWYLAALLVLPAAALAVAVASHGTAPLAAIAGDPNLVIGWVTNVALAVLMIQLWEETGWTGFVLHRLQPRFGPLVATVLTTWAQAAIHLPLLFIIGGVSDVRVAPDQYPFYLFALFVFPLGNRTVATWLYNRSGYSVPVVALAHSVWNLAAGPSFLPQVAPGMTEIWAYAGFGVVAVALVVATRGRLGYEGPTRGEQRAAAPALRSAGATTR